MRRPKPNARLVTFKHAMDAEAFRRVTGRPMVALPQLPGRMESEIFFEALALNEAVPSGLPSPATAGGEELLARFSFELSNSFAARRSQLLEQGRLLRECVPLAATETRDIAADFIH